MYHTLKKYNNYYSLIQGRTFCLLVDNTAT